MSGVKKEHSWSKVGVVIAFSFLFFYIKIKSLLTMTFQYPLDVRQHFFEKNRAAFEELKLLAMTNQLVHNDTCVSAVAFEIPDKYKYLFADPTDCILFASDGSESIIELPVTNFYEPLVYTQNPDTYKDDFWDIDGYDLRRTRDLGGNWFLTRRDWN